MGDGRENLARGRLSHSAAQSLLVAPIAPCSLKNVAPQQHSLIPFTAEIIAILPVTPAVPTCAVLASASD